jgi:hypothetical protein
MKKLVALFIFLISFTNLFAQKYYSKMFDTYGNWESFSESFGSKKDTTFLVGFNANFFVTDSTRFQSVFITSLIQDSLLVNKILFAKDSFNVTGLMIDKNGKSKKFINSMLDLRENTYLQVTYFLNELSTNNDSIETKKQLFISNNFYSKYWIKVDNNFYCFGQIGNYDLTSKIGFYKFDSNGENSKYHPLNGSGKIINNVVETKDGNFLIAGLKYFGISGNDSAFAWYAKVDTLGNILWEKDLIRGSDLMCEYVWATKANDGIYLTGTNYANYPSNWYRTVYGDTSFSYMLKINENDGKIEWQKKYLYSVNTIRGLLSSMGGMTFYNNSLYALINHKASERENPQDLSQYVMFAKFDLQGNLIWKRLFSNWYLSNRAYSLTPTDDGFLICGDSKDSTHAKGDSDAWLIKTDSNGCIIPGCNAKDNVVQIINPEKVFTVYPNPAQNEINVSSENLDIKIESLAIYNMQGQLVEFRQAQLPEKEITKINTEGLANGNYLLIITTDKKQMAGKKFVVER